MKATQVKPEDRFKTPDVYRGGTCTTCGKEIPEYGIGIRMKKHIYCDHTCMQKANQRKEHY